MIRRPPRATQGGSSAASDVYKRQAPHERLEEKKITAVVRARPILGWAVAEDAARAGIGAAADALIDPGANCIGLPLSQCSQDLRTAFDQADLVIAKGQAAYETLGAERKTIYVLMRVCLLYTSDAADDLLCVGLGGRRIIKKNNTNATKNFFIRFS